MTRALPQLEKKSWVQQPANELGARRKQLTCLHGGERLRHWPWRTTLSDDVQRKLASRNLERGAALE